MEEYDSSSRLYAIWKGIKRRCDNPNYHSFDNYGGRGISLCDEWRDFKVFARWSIENGYNDSLTIERIDNNGIYEPSNCKWADRVEQNNNTSRNHFVEVDGGLYTLAELERIYGIKQNTILYRLKRGWTPEAAVSGKVQVHKR